MGAKSSGGIISAGAAFRASRRRWLARAGALASAAALPFPHVHAQHAAALSVLPRMGLVIGNTRYAEAPLRNPANDAHAIGGELQKLGFEVNVRLDAGRSEMLEAIRAFSSELARRKAVGLFYYAGHGAQLAWRNYLIPVDAVIGSVEDMRARTVELNTLIAGLAEARNPMNVIILDACRDNPFGAKGNLQQKGLSQFDAPPGSLLAYATAPGNVANDGDGANGLYTENLLRELRAPEAKIEDVFKRVRLAVRRHSNGLQIPWESTSLEEDFYFRPPRAAAASSEQGRRRRFEEELAIWERIHAATEPAPLEDYLRRYPSGRFAEIAQFRLDQVLAAMGEKKVEAAPQAQNPYSKGTLRVDTRLRLGDVYTYRVIDMLTQQELRRFPLRVTEITDTQVVFNNGSLITDLIGNPVKLPDGTLYTDAQHYIADYSLGKRWTARHRLKRAAGYSSDSEIDYRVVAREKISLPAGEFEAFRVEGRGWSEGDRGVFSVYNRYWVAPEVRRYLVLETRQTHSSGKVVRNERTELVGYVQK